MSRSPRLFFLILAGLLLLSATRWLGPGSRSHASTLPSQDSFQGTSAAPLLLANVGSPSPGKAINLPEPREILVKFKASIGTQAIDALNQAHSATLLSTNPTLGVHSLRVPPGVSAQEMASRYAADPAVEFAEPNHARRITLAPTDPFYSANQKWYYDLMRAEQGWGLETGRSSVVVAVVDSGVMCTHPDLAANMWKNPGEVPGNGIDDDNNGKVDDVFGWDFAGSDRGADGDQPGDKDPCVAKGDSSVGDGLDNDGDGAPDLGVSHGTEVAGIVGAAANNGQGVAGMAWGSRIMAVRAMNPEGIGGCGDISNGIVYAAQNGAEIINLSLGSDSLCQTEALAIDLAHDSFGAVVTAASGNENQTPISYPARLAKTIAVGASDHADPDGRAPFSNWGPELAVVAPGVDIVSTSIISMAEAAVTTFEVGQPVYGLGLAGTSESTPLVSGLAALLLSRNPGLTSKQIRAQLTSTARDLPDDPDDFSDAGAEWACAGMIDAFAALSAASGAPIVTAPPPPPAGGAPALVEPKKCTVLSKMGAVLRWIDPPNTTQYQIQVIPYNNDGLGINLIRNAENSFSIEAPVFAQGNYVILPDMTYSWRVRTTSKTTFAPENDRSWGPWSETRTFHTPAPSNIGISAVFPANGARVSTRPQSLQWANTAMDVFYYEIQASTDRTFETDPTRATAAVWWNLVHGGVTTPLNSWTTPSLQAGLTYFWRVRPRVQGDGIAVAWSQTFRFTVSAATPTPTPTPLGTPTATATRTPIPTPTATPTPTSIYLPIVPRKLPFAR